MQLLLRVGLRRFATKAAKKTKKVRAAVPKAAAPTKKLAVVKKAATPKPKTAVAKKVKAAARAEAKAKAVAARKARRAQRKAKAAERKAKVAARRAARKQRKEKKITTSKARRQRKAAAAKRRAAKKASRVQAKKQKRVVAKPWKATHKSLPTRGYAAFVKAEFKNERKGSEPATTVIKRLAKRYKSLSAQERAPFEKEAAKNRQVKQAAKDKLQGLRMTPYALFVRENFASASQGVSGKGKAKIGKVGKELAAKWKSLSASGKQEYAKKALTMRAAAQRNVDAMIKK